MFQFCANLCIAKFRTSVSAFHYVAAFAIQNAIVNLITDANRGATVARRRLHKNASERRVQQNLAVHNRVVSHASRQSEISQTRALMQVIQDMKTNLFKSQLQAGSNILLAG